MSGDLPFPDDLPPLAPPPLPDWLADPPPVPQMAMPELPELPPLPPLPPPPDEPPLTRTPPPAARRPLAVAPTPAAGRVEQEVVVEPITEANGMLAYRTVIRPNPGQAFSDCRVSFPPPAGLKQVFASRKPAARAGRLHWELGTVRHRGEVGLYVRFPDGPTVVTCPRTYTVSFVPVPDSLLAIEPTAPPTVTAGEPFTAAVRVRNAGAVPSGPVTVTVRPAAGPPLARTLPAIDPNSERLAAFTLTAAAGPQAWEVTAADGDDVCKGELAVVAAVPAVALELAHPPAVRVDDTAELTLTVTNPGTVPARGLAVRLELPVELAYEGSAGGRYDPGAACVEWTAADLPPGGRKEWAVRVRGFAPGLTAVRVSAAGANGLSATAAGSLFCEMADRSMSVSALDALLAAAPAFAPDDDQPAAPKREATGLRHLLFDLAGTRYAVPLANVAEVIRPPAVTPVPGAPDWLDGVANVRGDIVPVIDLAAFLGLTPEPAGRPAVLLAQTDDADRTVGLKVDAVAGLRRLPAELPAAPAGLDDEPVTAFLAGLAEVEDRVLPRLHVDRLLRATELTAV